jgi:hypothetical protein
MRMSNVLGAAAFSAGVCIVYFAFVVRTPENEAILEGENSEHSRESLRESPSGETETETPTPALAPETGKPTANAVNLTQGRDRLQKNRNYVERVFAPVLDAFQLTPAQRQRVDALFVEWAETRDDTIEAVRGRPLGSVLMDRATAKTLAEVESRLDQIVDSQTSDKLRQVLQASGEFGMIANGYGKSCQSAGYPLSPHQRLTLGLALNQVLNSVANAAAFDRSRLPVDADGLNVLDREVLKRLEANLSPPQRHIIQKSLMHTNRATAANRKPLGSRSNTDQR